MPAPLAIAQFLAKYTPEIAAQLQEAREHLASHFPRGFELVYDNYNALVFGFGPSERAGDAILSVAGYPKWVTLFFLKGKQLHDPESVLQGSGAQVRSVRLSPPSLLHGRAVQALIRAAIAPLATALASAPPLETIIKSVSRTQRPRQPVHRAGAKSARSSKAPPE
jgi:hypothetical protein